MKIFAQGDKIQTDELVSKLSSPVIEWQVSNDYKTPPQNLQSFDIIFDLKADEKHSQLSAYVELKGKPVIISAVKKSLAEMLATHQNAIDCSFIGINALPTFINKPLAEVSVFNQLDINTLTNTFNALNWEYKLVNDRVGMVTPRVICMIINEACYTVQEGTASVQDIDISMKLGTNYPFGPFEWSNKIGIKNVYETLEALYNDTHDERYKICPLLKTHYLKQQPFILQ